MKQENKQKQIEYLGSGYARITCECGSKINLFFNQNVISKCEHCKKELKVLIHKIEIKTGTKMKKLVESRKSVKPTLGDGKINHHLIEEIKEKIINS